MEDGQELDGAADFQNEMAAALEEIGNMHMPFGKFGPQSFPPRGVPIYDLPVEYLLWFREKGFPRGRLGRLLEIVMQLKLDGAEAVFQIFRDKAGGRHPLKQPRQKSWEFDRE